MSSRRTALLGVVSVSLSLACGASSAQLASADHPDAVLKRGKNIEISVSAPPAKISAGETPWLIVTVENLTDEEIAYPGQYRVHIEGPHGEVPTTLLQRQVTHTLKPGEPSLMEGGFQNTIKPHSSFTMRYDLPKFYELSPGNYTIFIELEDEIKTSNPTIRQGLWVRSDTIPLVLR